LPDPPASTRLAPIVIEQKEFAHATRSLRSNVDAVAGAKLEKGLVEPSKPQVVSGLLSRVTFRQRSPA
jgi:hypothetical protein